MAPALSLEDADRLLDPRPLDFEHRQSSGAASNPRFYEDPPFRKDEKVRLPGPIERIRERLLRGTRDTKVFLSGHVGSGKSTELSRLAVEKLITSRFTVVPLRFEEQEWATLDAPQVLFRLGAALYQLAEEQKLIEKKGHLASVLQEINQRIAGATGIQVREGSTSLELNVLIVKLRQELKLSSKVRSQFREFGETHQSLLQDFVGALVNEVENNLARKDLPSELLLLVDDMDKVRDPERQRDIFQTNLNALMAPAVRVVYTLPTGVSYGANSADVRNNLEHLFPVRVLRKAPDTWRPEDAYDDERFGFFQSLVRKRVGDGLIEDDAIRMAAIYSGGVLREFFRLLREGIRVAEFNALEVLDGSTMRYAVKDATLKETMGLFAPDYAALARVHQVNDLQNEADKRYLDQARVLECYNAATWFEVNPLLWGVVGRHAKSAEGG